METAMSGRSRQRRHKEERLNVTLEDDQGHRVGDMMGERSRLVERRTKLSRRSSICAIAATPALTRMQAPSPVIVSQLTKLVGQARWSRRMPAIVNNFNYGGTYPSFHMYAWPPRLSYCLPFPFHNVWVRHCGRPQ